jgi:hypothetical protein
MTMSAPPVCGEIDGRGLGRGQAVLRYAPPPRLAPHRAAGTRDATGYYYGRETGASWLSPTYKNHREGWYTRFDDDVDHDRIAIHYTDQIGISDVSVM